MIKTTLKIVLATLITTGLANLEAKAQDTEKLNRTTVSIETDPSTFGFNGYAFHFRIKPKNSKEFVIGAGTYGLDLPNIMVDMNEKNKNKGWSVRISSAYSIFSEYYLKEANNKWYVGLQTGIQNFKNTNDNVLNKESKYSNLLIMPSVGYNWQPFKLPLYVKPWLGIGYTSKISGSNNLGNLEYDISSIVPFATVHVGYTFK